MVDRSVNSGASLPGSETCLPFNSFETLGKLAVLCVSVSSSVKWDTHEPQHLACSRHLPVNPPCLFLSHQELLWAGEPRCMGSCRLDGVLPALTSYYSHVCSELL